MTGKESREDRVEQMVKDGWSREFAEAYLPMTRAQARREGRTIRAYVSPMSQIVRRTKR